MVPYTDIWQFLGTLQEDLLSRSSRGLGKVKNVYVAF